MTHKSIISTDNAISDSLFLSGSYWTNSNFVNTEGGEENRFTHPTLIDCLHVGPTLIPLAEHQAILLAIVSQLGISIRFIENPSEEMKLAAVKQDSSAIRYIKNPSEAVQLAAVKQSGSVIQYIEEPSEEVRLAAVQENGYAIRYIKDPSEAVQLAAVNQNGWIIQYLEDPSEAVQLAAIACRDRYTSYYTINPFEKVEVVTTEDDHILHELDLRYERAMKTIL